MEAMTVKASRKEYQWSKMNSEDRKLWSEAAIKGWQTYLEDEAVQVLDMKRSAEVRRELAQKGELDKITCPWFVLADKADGLRPQDQQFGEETISTQGVSLQLCGRNALH